ncbi:MAG: L,D-transpeptidase family protein [Fimbriimonadaceae bacterium]|nr:L,D-transpeptidase family protein [Chitinophagales bacterium]
MKPLHILSCTLLCAAIFFSCRSKNKKTHTDDALNTSIKVDTVIYPLITDSITIENFLAKHPVYYFHRNEIFTFYKNRNYAYAWFNNTGMVEQAGNFMNLLIHFDDEGLRDSIMYVAENNSLYQKISNPDYYYQGADENTLHFDLALTSNFFVYAQKVWGGMSEKQTKDLNWYISRKTIPYVSILDSILTGKRASFTAYEPVYAQYNLLKKYLKKYKALAKENTTWEILALPKDVNFFKEGDSSEIIAQFKERLFILGDMQQKDSSAYFDETTAEAVKNFQIRYGLAADSTAGKNFFDAINTSPEMLVRQIEINMERCRWVPYDLKGDYITVNIPEFKMHIYDDDTLAWDMSVIVGKSSTSTTIFNDYLEYIIFSPYWEITPNIIANEIVPAQKKNSSYLSKNNMEVTNGKGQVIDASSIDWNAYSGSDFPYSVRQRPGAGNSLGWVKFIFPNSYSIYFHDTPTKNLFSSAQRSFSHGCIRLSEPKRFAEYLLRDDSTWTTAKIESVMYKGKPTQVNLKEKIPVFIAYFTAWVDKSGNINFRKDIYKHDEKLEETLYTTTDI